MKKSEIYLKAQVAVLKTETVGVFDKLEILRELMSKEDIERMFEEKKEQEGVAQAA